MYAIINKILLLIAFFGTNLNAIKVKISELTPGDIIDFNNLNPESTETYGDIFNGNAAHFIETKDFSVVKHINVYHEVCLSFSSLKTYYYPEVKIDNKSYNLYEFYNYTIRDKLSNFDLKNKKNYSYAVVKVCRIVKNQKLVAEVLNRNEFPFVNHRINYKLLLDKTSVLRFKNQNQTHYVSSITIGECFLQAYANTVEFCRQIDQSKITIQNFIESSLYQTQVKINGGSQDRENMINDYMNLIHMSLINLYEPSVQKSFFKIFDVIPKLSAIEVNLKSLPNLPEKSPLLSIADEKLITDIVPGDVININDLKHVESTITTDNILVDISDQKTSPFTNLNYTNCHKFDEDDAVKVEYTPYKLYSNYSIESFYKFDVFEQTVRRQYYGIDPQYLSNRYKCLKIKICSEFKRRKLIISSIYVVSLNKSDAQKFHIFENKNVVLRYALANETHYVTRTEKGNCLFQALVFQNLDSSVNFEKIPFLYKGSILSATNNRDLEEWARNFVDNYPTKNYKTLLQLVNNRTALETILSKISNSGNVLTNIYLDKLN